MLSQTVEYALRAAVCLADDPQASRTTGEIAHVTRVPPAYLSKVLQALTRAGLVHSQRGIGGGMRLNRSPDRITILEVVNAVDPIERIRSCPLGLPGHGVRLCPLHKRLDEAHAMVESAFASVTLAEVLDEPDASVPLCDFPPHAASTS